MANETGVSTGLYTGIMNAGCCVAFCAIVHLHTIPGVVLKSGNTMPPDIAAVTGPPVFFVGSETFGGSGMAVASDAI